MSDGATAIAAAEQNYFAAWRLLADRSAGCAVEETDDVLFTFFPDSAPYFNSAFVKPPADPVSCIATIRRFFADRDTQFTLRHRDTPDAGAVTEATGFAPGELSPLMNAAVEHLAPPSGIDIRRVDADNWDDHLAAISAGFGMPSELTSRLFDRSLSGSEEYAAFNAYIDDEIASTAALIVSGSVAGVYNVATAEAFRRRGLGEATTRAAAAEGRRRGCVIATLQASEMGYPIYERMGFQTVASWRSRTGSA